MSNSVWPLGLSWMAAGYNAEQILSSTLFSLYRAAGGDAVRDNQAGAHGILSTRYGWREVYGHPCETALLQTRILRKRGWTGKPRPCSPACPVGQA